MGITVQVDTPPVTLQMVAAVRGALLESALPILEVAKAGAPYEQVPRHGEHLRDTGYARLQAAQADGSDMVEIGFTAFYAPWQHEHLDWHHEHGHAKFLELAVVGGAQAWGERVAALIRGALEA